MKEDIQWIFNPQVLPTLVEYGKRQIRTVQKIMLSIVKEQVLSDEGLQTLLYEIEAIVNGRPITTVYGDSNNLEALTPNHLLLMKVQPQLPPTMTSKTDMYAQRRWRQVQYLADLLWRRWTREYLPHLQQHQKRAQPRRNVQVGDVVLIVDDTQPRNSWQPGTVLETMPNKRGHVSKVKLRTQSSVLLRPISKVCLLLEAGMSEQVSK